MFDEIEQGMTMVGTTAIEDKLQDGVPDAIANLAKVRIEKLKVKSYKLTQVLSVGNFMHVPEIVKSLLKAIKDGC